MTKLRRLLITILGIAMIALSVYYIFLRTSHSEAEKGNITVVKAVSQTEPMEHELFIQEEYIPVIPEGSNIALDATAEANYFEDVYTPRKATDGNTQGISYWEGTKDSYPNILTVSWQEMKLVHAIKVCLSPLPVWSTRIQTFSVEISSDGETFTEFIASMNYEFNPKKGNEVVLEFDETEVKSVRLVFTSNSGATGAQVAEFEVYSLVP